MNQPPYFRAIAYSKETCAEPAYEVLTETADGRIMDTVNCGEIATNLLALKPKPRAKAIPLGFCDRHALIRLAEPHVKRLGDL